MTTKVPDLNDLHLLISVANSGSIGQAAVSLGITQPSASRRLAGLERSLRLQLVHRGARGTTLTSTGQVVVDWAAVLLQATEQFNHDVRTLGQEQDRLLRAGLSMTIAEHYAPMWLARLRSQSPQTVVTVSMANSTRIMGLVESGQVEIGLVETPRLREGLQSLRIGTDELAIAVPPEHPWSDPRLSVDPAELANGQLLLREQGSGTRDTFDLAMANAGHQVHPVLELASNTGLCSAALAGMGAVALPAVAMAHELRTGSLVKVQLQDISLKRPLSVVWTENASFSHHAAALFLKAIDSDHRDRAAG